MAARSVSMPVRLLDLSADGMLLACPLPLAIAAIPRVASWFAGRRLEVDLVVRHVSGRWDDEACGYLVGGRFAELDRPARRVLDALLAGAPQLAAGEPAFRVRRGRALPPLGDEARSEPVTRRRQRPRPKRGPRFARLLGADSAPAGERGLADSADPTRQPA